MRAALVSLFGAILLPAAAVAADLLVPELEQRLESSGVERLNTYLVSQWPSAMIPLNRKTASCDLRAVSLAVRLSRSTNARAAQAHQESLREAIGSCTAYVLALASPEEVPKVCASVASWSVMQTVRELRRRIAAIESDQVLRASKSGKSCREAYLYELNNTRVVLRSRPQESSNKGK
jgi:hypothetical protein